jgi:hypothetical protein
MIAICVLLLRDNLDENRGSKLPHRRAAKPRDDSRRRIRDAPI